MAVAAATVVRMIIADRRRNTMADLDRTVDHRRMADRRRRIMGDTTADLPLRLPQLLRPLLPLRLLLLPRVPKTKHLCPRLIPLSSQAGGRR